MLWPDGGKFLMIAVAVEVVTVGVNVVAIGDIDVASVTVGNTKKSNLQTTALYVKPNYLYYI